MLSLCIDSAITKIAYKKPIHLKEKTYKKVQKDITIDDIQTTDTTMTLISKEEQDEDIQNTTPYSKETSLPTETDSFETTSKEDSTTTANNVKATFSTQQNDLSCTCGIFLSSQFVKGSPEPPKGEPVISTTLERSFQCNPIGQKQCQTKCLEQVNWQKFRISK